MASPSTIRVFYSWQSDRPNATNRTFIAHCLKRSKKVIETDSSRVLNVYIDDATRDETGAPQIPTTILNKIVASDVVVADLTIIQKSGDYGRPTPNPNVLIELGFAVGRLGWPRVLAVFNAEFGTFPGDLPFDIERRRVTPYEVGEASDSAARSHATDKLSRELVRHIRSIAERNPPRPTDEGDDAVRRSRDIEMLSVVCGSFDLAAVHQHCDDIQRGFVSDEILYYHAWLTGILGSLSFHLYDAEARTKADELQRAWSQAMPRPEFTDTVERGHRFKQRGVSMTEEEEGEWHRMRKSWRPLHDALKSFTDHIRTRFVEVDINEASRRARAAWLE